ncbi:MAG TPA: YceI family protein [Gammaproteobacteria bacterium]|nr:YceI family protein [Gammaproteobacteria bacterium]
MRRTTAILLYLIGILFTVGADAGCWVPVPAASRISFNISQAGAPLQGTFGDYDGLICIGTDDATADHIKVQIRTSSVNTQLPELDEALRGADFFDVAHWPQATFESESVRALGQGHYEVQGKLTLRDVTRSLKVPFTFNPGSKDGARLEGHLSIQRLDYHIGLGQWADTRWIGNQVDIEFSVMLKPVKQH